MTLPADSPHHLTTEENRMTHNLQQLATALKALRELNGPIADEDKGRARLYLDSIAEELHEIEAKVNGRAANPRQVTVTQTAQVVEQGATMIGFQARRI